MDIDYISTQKVDEDAQIEREQLQRLKRIQNASKNIATSKTEDDESFKVDSYSKLEKIGCIVTDEYNLPCNIMLMKVELQRWGNNTDTS